MDKIYIVLIKGDRSVKVVKGYYRSIKNGRYLLRYGKNEYFFGTDDVFYIYFSILKRKKPVIFISENNIIAINPNKEKSKISARELGSAIETISTRLALIWDANIKLLLIITMLASAAAAALSALSLMG